MIQVDNTKMGKRRVDTMLTTAQEMDFNARRFIDSSMKMIYRMGDLTFTSRETCATGNTYISGGSIIHRIIPHLVDDEASRLTSAVVRCFS